MKALRAPTGRDLSQIPWSEWTTVEKRWFHDIVMQCADCGAAFESRDYYMVKNTIWGRHGERSAFLCVGCLETRMGRSLVYEDLADVPLRESFIHYRPEYGPISRQEAA